MSEFDDAELPPELGYVADQLRSHRYEASALELDQTKTRILKRAGGQRVARGGRMRKRSLLTAVIMFAAIGTGSAAALSVAGVAVPVIGPAQTSRVVPAKHIASIAQYGHLPTVTVVRCSRIVVRAGQSTRCTATVYDITVPTGTVTFTSQGVTHTCTLRRSGFARAACSVTIHPKVPAVRHRSGIYVIRINASYSGDATHAPSSTRAIVVLHHRSIHRRLL